MNRIQLKNNKLIIILAIFLVFAIAASIYFFVLYPKMETIKLKEMELQSQEQLLSTIQTKVADTNDNTFESTANLQGKVPVKPMIQQLLLDIEKAEVLSGSFVANMTFQDGEVLEFGESDSEINENVEENTDSLQTVDEIKNATPLPTGVEKVSVNLTIESQTYFEFERFLQSLESLERIIVVDALDFTANDEIIEENQENKPLTFHIMFSAFYMPSLSDLMDQLPKIETPKPANKKNPFSSFGDYSNNMVQRNMSSKMDSSGNTETESDNNVEEEVGSEQETSSSDHRTNDVKNDNNSIEHTVKLGDTIFKLALKYYNSNEGLEIIREANNLKGNKIIPGQILKIPNINN